MSRIFVLVAVAGIAGALFLGSTCGLLNKPPSVPEISGPTTGIVGVPVTFTATATDPDDDSIAFQFAWGDGDTSDWSALFASGETTSLSHAYADSSTFSVKARTRVGSGSESAWSAGDAVSISGAGSSYPDSVVGRITTYSGAYQMAVTADGNYLYVTHQGYDILSVIDIEARRVLKTISVGQNANDVALSADGAYALVTAFSDSSLSIVSTADSLATAKVNVGHGPQQVAADPAGSRAFVAVSSAGWIAVVSLPNGDFEDTLRIGGSPIGVVVDSTADRLYVSDATGRRILVFELPSLRQVNTIALTSRPYALSLGPGEMLYASTAGDTAAVSLRTSDGVVTGYLPARQQLLDIAVAPGGEYLYASFSRGMYYVHAATMTVVDSLLVAQPPTVHGILADRAGTLVYVANSSDVVVVGEGKK